MFYIHYCQPQIWKPAVRLSDHPSKLERHIPPWAYHLHNAVFKHIYGSSSYPGSRMKFCPLQIIWDFFRRHEVLVWLCWISRLERLSAAGLWKFTSSYYNMTCQGNHLAWHRHWPSYVCIFILQNSSQYVPFKHCCSMTVWPLHNTSWSRSMYDTNAADRWFSHNARLPFMRTPRRGN